MGSTSFQDLNLSNYFLFAAAAEDEETSRLLLNTLLGIRVGHVKVNVEHTIPYSSDFRSVRLDVFVSDEVQVRYNMEMENRGREALPKRSRYHQAEMDVMSLKPGEDYTGLRPVYVVFICTFDPFDRGLYRYTFENRCAERDYFPLEDGAVRVFLSTKGTNDAEVPKALVNLLGYVEDSTDAYVDEVNDPNVRRLHDRVTELKRSREWEARYMQFQELLKEQREEGIREGRKEGIREGEQEERARLLRLTSLMLQAGETDMLGQLEQEPELLEAMLQKYHL